MTDSSAHQLWLQIREALEEKLQYGLLDQAKRIAEVALEGSELVLRTADEEAFQFFSAQVNQQRLVIASRGIFALSSVKVERYIDPEPLAEKAHRVAEEDEGE